MSAKQKYVITNHVDLFNHVIWTVQKDKVTLANNLLIVEKLGGGCEKGSTSFRNLMLRSRGKNAHYNARR